MRRGRRRCGAQTSCSSSAPGVQNCNVHITRLQIEYVALFSDALAVLRGASVVILLASGAYPPANQVVTLGKTRWNTFARQPAVSVAETLPNAAARAPPCRLNWQLHFGEPPRWAAGVKFILVDTAASERDARKVRWTTINQILSIRCSESACDNGL